MKMKEQGIPRSLTKVVATSFKKKSRGKKPVSMTDKPKSLVQRRAEEIQSNLCPDHPSLVTIVEQSHVSEWFLLTLPLAFWSYLPKYDTDLTLLDEEGEHYVVNWHAHDSTISGGWKRFVTAHKLVAGDAMVFHLVEATKLKVYIVRACSLADADVSHDLLNFDKPTPSVTVRAEELQSRLGPKYPSFVKVMMPSHVSGSFWLTLPLSCYCPNLPREDINLTLLDQYGERYIVKYIAPKSALSAGWRRFAMVHKLAVGDALVFQLVEATKFKVYIVRACGSADVDVAHDLPDSDIPAEGSVPGAKEMNATTESSPNHITSHPASPVVNSKDHVESDAEIQNLESFNIIINDLVIDPDISENVRTKYYELCRSQKTCLHKHLMQGLSGKIVAQIISETVNIADAIRACKLSTPRDKFQAWEKSLLAFKHLGMNVGFLLSRVGLLQQVALEFDYNDAMSKENRLKEESATVETIIRELRNEFKRLEREAETHKLNTEKHESAFQSVVSSPW